MKFVVHSIADLGSVCDEIIKLGYTVPVFAFYGDLGSGKTTLIQALCKKIGVTQTVTSPTYAIVHEYEGNGKPIYHIDLYRIKSTEEALQTGLEEYLDSGNICLIEWPDHFEKLLPGKHVKIFIRKLDNENRSVEIIKSDEGRVSGDVSYL